MTPRQLAQTLGALAAAYVVIPPSRNATLISDMGQAYGNMVRAALGAPPLEPPAPARPPRTLAGARQHLYDTHRRRWIDTGDVEELRQMLRYVTDEVG